MSECSRDGKVSSGTVVVFGRAPTIAVLVETFAFGVEAELFAEHCG
jgi:hypothetical protein